MIALLFFFLRDFLLPIGYFAIVNGCASSRTERNASVLVMSITVITYSVAVDLLMFDSRNFAIQLIFRLAWVLVCAFMVLSRSLAEVEEAEEQPSRFDMAVFVAGGVFVLLVNAFATYLLAPSLSTVLHIEPMEIILLPMTAILVAVYSYKLGKKITGKYSTVKMLGWAVAVLASEFLALALPKNLGFSAEDMTLWYIWVIVSVFAFAPCLLAFAVNNRKVFA